MATVTIRIPPSAHDRARRMAKAEETTLGEVIDDALKRRERERMLEGYNQDMARLRSDPVAWADWQAEIAEWDGTLLDGLEDDPYEEFPESRADSNDSQE
jgi:hypothetical protein